jgi:predicted transport protein
VQSHLDNASPQVGALYERFVELVNNCGDVIIEATKTSIAFKSPGLFAVVHIQKKGLKVGFWLPRRIDHPRIFRVEAITPQEYVHDVKLISLDDLDDQLQNWLCEAYAVGM